MIVTSLVVLKRSNYSWVDVDGNQGSNRKTFAITTVGYCQRTLDAAFAFGTLGTYQADITKGMTYQGSPATPYSDTGTYTFHVGPVAELAVSDSGDLPTLASGETAYTVDFTNHGPDAALQAKVAVKLPAGATQVRTVPAGLGTWHAAGTTNGVTHTNPYWTWDAGAIAGPGNSLPRGGQATIVVSGVTAGATATATVSNGNGECTASGQTAAAPFIIREADCDAISGAAWTKVNPYKVCIDSGTDGTLANVYPNPFNETTCEATSGNEWHEGTVYDHRPGNNVAPLTARSGGSAGLSGASATSPTMVLNWPATTGASEYRIFRSNTGAAGSYRQFKIVKAPATTYTDAAVSAGSTYYYQVEALYPDYRLAETYTASLTVMAPPAAPMAPGSVRSLTASRRSSPTTTIDVSWSAPSNSTASTRYDVEYQSRDNNSSPWVDSATKPAVTEQTATTYTLSGADGADGYRFRVRAVNVVGEDRHPSNPNSNWSGYATVGPLRNPDQVQNLTATRQSNGTTINVTWQKPSSGTDPTRYEVQYQSRTGNSGSWGSAWTSLTPNITHDDTTTTFTSTLTTATGANSYRFQVRTVTVSGGDTIEGSWKTSSVVPAFNNPDQVQNLTAVRDATTKTTINVGWNPPATNGTAPTHYDVQYQQDGGAWKPDTPDRQAVADPLTYQLTNATGASAFRFRVRTATQSGNDYVLGSWRTSGTVAKLPAPGQAQNLTATRAANETIIDATWAAPASGGTAPTHYDVQYQVNGGSWTPDPATRQVETNKTYRVTDTGGSAANSSYRFRVRSVTVSNNVPIRGSWAYSNTVPRLTAPSQVTSLTATRQTDETKIDVTWTAPQQRHRRNHLRRAAQAGQRQRLASCHADVGCCRYYDLHAQRRGRRQPVRVPRARRHRSHRRRSRRELAQLQHGARPAGRPGDQPDGDARRP